MTLLLDDPDDGPATSFGVETWREQFSLTRAIVAADPHLSLLSGDTVITPQQTIVDPRTMKVIAVSEGWSGEYPAALFEVAYANAE